MAQNLPELRTLVSHSFAAELAEPNAVSFTSSLQNNPIAVRLRDKIVAQHRRPSEATIKPKAGGFVGSVQRTRFLRGELARPLRRMFAAIFALGRIVRI